MNELLESRPQVPAMKLKSQYEFRWTNLYTDAPRNDQNVIFPENPSYENSLNCLGRSESTHDEWQFILQNGDETKFAISKNQLMDWCKFEPDKCAE